MRLRSFVFGLFAAAALLGVGLPAHAQTYAGGVQVWQAWKQLGFTSITAGTATTTTTTTTSSGATTTTTTASTTTTTLYPATGVVPITAAPVAWVCNTGGAVAYVKLGAANVAAGIGDFPIVNGTCAAMAANGAGFLSAITASSTTTLLISLGYGHP